MTDGQHSYALFIYNCRQMEWSGSASIGVNADGKFFQNHRLSRMNNAASIACLNSPESDWSNVIYLLRKLEILCNMQSLRIY